MIKEEKIKIKSDDVELGTTVAYNNNETSEKPLILLIRSCKVILFTYIF